MRKLYQQRKSIAFRLTVIVILLVTLQSGLWIVTLLKGGVLDTAKENAYQFFEEKVGNRAIYIQNELKKRQDTLQLFVPQMQEVLRVLGPTDIPTKQEQQACFEALTPILISLTRTSYCTGAFVILNDNITRQSVHSAVYLRDYDAGAGSQDYRDISLVVGPSEVAQAFKTSMDENWVYSLTLTENNSDFYEKPYESTDLTQEYALLGYWSRPFVLSAGDVPVITYSMPIADSEGRLRGVAGIELTTEYFNTMLPANELSEQDSLGYLISADSQELQPVLTSSAYQESVLREDVPMGLKRVSAQWGVSLVEHIGWTDPIFASVHALRMYDRASPFEQEGWYLAGLSYRSDLLQFYDSVIRILFGSVVVSLVLAVGCGVFVSMSFSLPIRALAEQVRKRDWSNQYQLGRIGLSEIDDLSAAIEDANAQLLENSGKMMQIIGMMDMPIGAYEYREDANTVFATDKLASLLALSETDAPKFFQDKARFISLLQDLQTHLAEGEDEVYAIASNPPRWIRLRQRKSAGSVLGVITDVTQEVRDKQMIRKERDFDSLTGLRGRACFTREVQDFLSKAKKGRQTGVCALCMFDLDNFKRVNDTYGHETGDRYLCAVANALSRFEHALAGRRSGDEFFVFFHGYETEAEVREELQRFYQYLQEHPFRFPDSSLGVLSASCGLAWRGDMDFEKWLHQADMTLYQAKRKKKGTLQESYPSS